MMPSRWATVRAAASCSSKRAAASTDHGPCWSALRRLPAHHQICPLWIAPVVIQWDDVWMLQVSDELGFHLEAAYEIRLAGVLGQDDFDGNLARYRRLVSAVHSPKAA